NSPRFLPSLVPKLRLGTPVAKLCFASGARLEAELLASAFPSGSLGTREIDDGFLPHSWSAEEGTNRSINHGSTSHEARTVQWPAVSGAGAGRDRRHLGREPGMGGRGAQGGEQAGRVPGRHVRVGAEPHLAVRSREEAGGAALARRGWRSGRGEAVLRRGQTADAQGLR